MFNMLSLDGMGNANTAWRVDFLRLGKKPTREHELNGFFWNTWVIEGCSFTKQLVCSKFC